MDRPNQWGDATTVHLANIGATTFDIVVDADPGTGGAGFGWHASVVTWDAASELLSDGFTDTNGVLLTAHTPDTGGPWIISNGSSPTIQSGKLAPVSTARVDCTVDSVYTDLSVAADITWQGSGALLTARYQDKNNRLQGGITGSGAFYVQYTAAGADTIIATTATGQITAGQTKRLELRVNGTTISLLVDSITVSSEWYGQSF